MKLRSMLAVRMTVIMFMTVVLVAFLSAGSIGSWRGGQDALARLEQLRHLLVVQEMLGLERGQTNALLSARSTVSLEAIAALAAQRRASDLSLNALAASPGLPEQVWAIMALVSLRLDAARAAADRVAEQAPGQRSTAEIGAVIARLGPCRRCCSRRWIRSWRKSRPPIPRLRRC